LSAVLQPGTVAPLPRDDRQDAGRRGPLLEQLCGDERTVRPPHAPAGRRSEPALDSRLPPDAAAADAPRQGTEGLDGALPPHSVTGRVLYGQSAARPASARRRAGSRFA